MFRLAPLLALVMGVASAGCLAQTTDTSSTDEADVVSTQPVEHSSDDSESSEEGDIPLQQLQLKLSIQSNGEADSPSPQPWLKAGPSPQPWGGGRPSIAQPKQGGGGPAMGGPAKP